MTYEELIALAKEGDPLIGDTGYEMTEDGRLYIHGANGSDEVGGSYASDMLIEIVPEGLKAWLRDCEGVDEPFHGSEWTEEVFFQEYESLVTWAYSW